MIHNEFLNGIPGLVAGNSVDIPSHLAFSSEDIEPQFTDNTLSGEIGSRNSLNTATVSDNTVTFNGFRPSTAPDADGDYLNSLGLFTAATDGNLWATALTASLLHETSFNIEVNHTVRFNRG